MSRTRLSTVTAKGNSNVLPAPLAAVQLATKHTNHMIQFCFDYVCFPVQKSAFLYLTISWCWLLMHCDACLQPALALIISALHSVERRKCVLSVFFFKYIAQQPKQAKPKTSILYRLANSTSFDLVSIIHFASPCSTTISRIAQWHHRLTQGLQMPLTCCPAKPKVNVRPTFLASIEFINQMPGCLVINVPTARTRCNCSYLDNFYFQSSTWATESPNCLRCLRRWSFCVNMQPRMFRQSYEMQHLIGRPCPSGTRDTFGKSIFMQFDNFVVLNLPKELTSQTIHF